MTVLPFLDLTAADRILADIEDVVIDFSIDEGNIDALRDALAAWDASNKIVTGAGLQTGTNSAEEVTALLDIARSIAR